MALPINTNDPNFLRHAMENIFNEKLVIQLQIRVAYKLEEAIRLIKLAEEVKRKSYDEQIQIKEY